MFTWQNIQRVGWLLAFSLLFKAVAAINLMGIRDAQHSDFKPFLRCHVHQCHFGTYSIVLGIDLHTSFGTPKWHI